MQHPAVAVSVAQPPLFSSSLFSRTCCSSVCLGSLECSPLLLVYLHGQDRATTSLVIWMWRGNDSVSPPGQVFSFHNSAVDDLSRSSSPTWFPQKTEQLLTCLTPGPAGSWCLGHMLFPPQQLVAETPLALVAHTAGPGCLHPGLSPVAGPVSCLLMLVSLAAGT